VLPGRQSAATLDTDRILPQLVLHADDDALADLRAQVLAPLAELPEATREKLAETLRSWLLHHGRRERVAAEHTWEHRLRRVLQLAKERFNLPW